MTTTLSCADATLPIINRPTTAPKMYAAPVLGALIPKIRFLTTSKRINETKIPIISVAGSPIDCDAKAKAKINAIAAYSKIGAINPSKKPSINAGDINCAFIYVPQKICSKQSVNLFLSNPSERSKPTLTLHARLPQKTPSASLGQARCLSKTAITQGEPSPEARRAFPPYSKAFHRPRPLHRRAQRSFAPVLQYEGGTDRNLHPIQKDYACHSVQKEALSVFGLFKRLTHLEVSIMAINEDTKLEELQRIKGELKELLPLLSKWRVEELQKLVSEHYTKKWRKRRFTKYGAINKGFTQSELDLFLDVVKEPRFRLLFSYQAYLGLRIGEACKLNMRDFDFKIRELRVNTEKAHTLDTLIVPQFLFEQTLEYIRTNQKAIEGAQGYLFYKDQQKSRKGTPYLDLNYVRNRFRDYISLVALNEAYASTDETIPNRAKRTLHRLTTHSLRHYAITTFNRAVNGNITLTKAFARHREIGSTQVYIHTSKDELYSAIECSFSNILKDVYHA
ncbi:MAG: site-specific integrase [Candidatus Marsarchaeota archaeon]|jgi:integrase|nr:site-specific integrase [Candidatus Marsarchaeota archaeon]MCL5111648.1 site-specific integrase [Candidatus Marsarchaeota archaeon]